MEVKQGSKTFAKAVNSAQTKKRYFFIHENIVIILSVVLWIEVII